MTGTCCWCIPLYYGVAILGAFELFGLLSSVFELPAEEDLIWSSFLVPISLFTCAAFAYALLATESLIARKWLLYFYIGHRICWLLQLFFSFYEL